MLGSKPGPDMLMACTLTPIKSPQHHLGNISLTYIGRSHNSKFLRSRLVIVLLLRTPFLNKFLCIPGYIGTSKRYTNQTFTGNVWIGGSFRDRGVKPVIAIVFGLW